jgi:CRP-like cAMP-binding protein
MSAPNGSPIDANQEAKVRTVRRGELVIREGQESSVAYVVKSGRLVAFKVRENTRITVGVAGPGEVVGELSVLSGKPATMNVEAEQYSELMEVDYGLLKKLLGQCPKPVRHIVDFMVKRQYDLARLVNAQSLPNAFLSICQILDLLWKAEQAKGNGPGQGVSLGAVFRTVKQTLPVSRIEIEEAVRKLAAVGILRLDQVHGARQTTDALGRKKTATFVEDRTVTFSDPASFLATAKSLAEELERQDGTAGRLTLEFVDLEDFAAQVESTAEMLYKKMANQEIPPDLFFLHKASAERWAADKEPGYFKRTKRRRLKPEELESVNDVVAVDGATLQEAFSALGFRKLTVLYAGAGEEAREKILANCSGKIAKVVSEEAKGLEADEAELGDAEDELIRKIKELKGIAQ